MPASVPPDAPSTLAPLERWLIAITAALVMLVSYVDRQTLAIFGTSVSVLLDDDPTNRDTKYGFLQAAFSIAYLVCAPIAGAMVDRIGARLSLVFAVLGWSVASAAQMFADSFWAFFVLRIALGTLESPSFPGATQVVRRVLLPHERPTGYGIVFSGSFIGAMIAGPVAIGMKEWLGSFQPAFLGTAIIGLLWVPLFVAATFRKRPREALAVVEPPPSALPRVSRLRFVGQPAVLRALVLVFASAPAIMFSLQWLPKYLHAVHGVEENELAGYIWLPALFFDVAAIGFGLIVWWRERGAPRREIRSHADLIAVGGLLASALALLPLLPSPSPWGAVVTASISMAGGAVLYTRLTSDMLARVNPAYVSVAGGLSAASQSLAYILFNPLVGKVRDETQSYTPIVIALGLLNVPGVIAWILWPMRERTR